MCGIVGEIRYNHTADTMWVEGACAIMRHRGPDGYACHQEGRMAFGHRRLSIIDLATGDQPMPYANRYWITYNGELYNYRDLRQHLQARGHRFRTTSDTEVILAAYAEWGADCVTHFDGIFAFGIWDQHDETLFIARDHLGVKPLLYHADAEGLRFASELKVLLGHPAITPQIDPVALQDYLALGYVLAPRTIIAGIHKLPAGHSLLVRGGHIDLRPYWHLDEFAQRDPFSSTEAHLIEAWHDLLRQHVEAQMVSDVPVGSFLSGGLDSATISYFANQHHPDQLNTFSMGFAEASYSELDYAQVVADHLGTAHHTQIIAPEAFDAFARMAWFYDEPLGDTSIIPMYYLAALTRQRVTVALSGDGADELLAGYDTYLADRLQQIYQHTPAALHRHLVQPLVNRLPASDQKVSWQFKARQFVANARQAPQRAHFGWRQMFNADERTLLTGTAAWDQSVATYTRYYADVPQASPLNQHLYVDVKTWLVDDILTKVDRATMAVGLEARVPFLSPRVVEFAMQLPPKMKLRGTQRKYILKQAMRDHLPTTTIKRRKSGFNAPIALWMKTAFADAIEPLFTQNRSTLVDAAALAPLWQAHKSGQADHGFKLWTLLSLLLWEETVYQPSPLDEVTR